MTLSIYQPIPSESPVSLPLFGVSVQAGFPSPADDHVKARLNIHDYLVKNDNYTFMVRVVGESMRDAGLMPGDIAVVDRSRDAAIGNIVLAVIDGEFTIKQLGRADNGNVLLCPANPAYQAIEITDATHFEIWGVVTGSLRKYL